MAQLQAVLWRTGSSGAGVTPARNPRPAPHGQKQCVGAVPTSGGDGGAGRAEWRIAQGRDNPPRIQEAQRPGPREGLASPTRICPAASSTTQAGVLAAEARPDGSYRCRDRRGALRDPARRPGLVGVSLRQACGPFQPTACRSCGLQQGGPLPQHRARRQGPRRRRRGPLQRAEVRSPVLLRWNASCDLGGGDQDRRGVGFNSGRAVGAGEGPNFRPVLLLGFGRWDDAVHARVVVRPHLQGTSKIGGVSSSYASNR